MKELAIYIQSQVKIEEQDLSVILSKFTEKEVGKGKFLLLAGQIATTYVFVQSGGLRIYLDKEKEDRQITCWAAFENDFFAELSSLKMQSPSRFNIQAIEDTVLLTINHREMERLYQKFPEWQLFGRLIWENAFLNVIEGIISHQTMSAEERYLAAMGRSDLMQRMSLKDLSSFLGITASSLSRIRKNLK